MQAQPLAELFRYTQLIDLQLQNAKLHRICILLFVTSIYVFQLTEETLGTSEKTELDAHFEHLAERATTTRKWTEKILKDMESMLTPNPGI